MILDAPTATLLVSVAVIVVFCVAFPKVRHTLLGVVSALDGIEALFYVLFGLAVVVVASWAVVYNLWQLRSGLM